MDQLRRLVSKPNRRGLAALGTAVRRSTKIITTRFTTTRSMVMRPHVAQDDPNSERKTNQLDRESERHERVPLGDASICIPFSKPEPRQIKTDLASPREKPTFAV
jgi:hypothetical protein